MMKGILYCNKHPTFSGVCCFPYGELLDQLFDIINKAQQMIAGKMDVSFFSFFKQLIYQKKG